MVCDTAFLVYAHIHIMCALFNITLYSILRPEENSSSSVEQCDKLSSTDRLCKMLLSNNENKKKKKKGKKRRKRKKPLPSKANKQPSEVQRTSKRLMGLMSEAE